MARCCWARRGIFGLQTENLEGERETHPNDLRGLLATACDRGCDTTCDSRTNSYSGAHGRDKDPTGHQTEHLSEGTRGNLRGNESMR